MMNNYEQNFIVSVNELRAEVHVPNIAIKELVKNRPTMLMTLIIVGDADKVLLGLKKRGFGVGKWNGFGGKVESGETITEAAKRELLEECGLSAKSLQTIGVLFFENANWKDITLHEVHLFRTTEYEGEPIETDEMVPKWFNRSELPFDKMLPPNRYWLPPAMDGQSFDALFVYENEDTLVDMKMDRH